MLYFRSRTVYLPTAFAASLPGCVLLVATERHTPPDQPKIASSSRSVGHNVAAFLDGCGGAQLGTNIYPSGLIAL
jgi:hypothetical protein